MVIGVLGSQGQVGQAIVALCEKKFRIVRRDLNIDEFKNTETIDILHVCIPYSQKDVPFETVIVEVIRKLNPKLTIINSTVRPGTTQSIYKKTKTHIVHAPILGKHPHLAKYQKIFIKPIGAVNSTAFDLAKKHFAVMGVKTLRFSSPFETELAKIMDTTYYAWNILFEKWVWKICEEQNVNFDDVYTRFNEIYNKGYAKSLPHVRRPVLIHKKGPIGGHCILPNLQILNELLKDDEIVDFMTIQGNKLP